MRLLTTDASFVLNGLPYQGIPFLLDEEMRLVEPVNRFLIYNSIHRGTSNSPKTWKTYGWHLYDYFSFLEANNLAWDCEFERGTPTVVSMYRNWSARRNSPNTVNQRIKAVVRFYQYAHNNRLIENLPWDMEDRVVLRDGGFLAHLGGSNIIRVADVMTRKSQGVIEVLTRAQIGILLNRLKGNKAHYLMTKLALATGLRKQEVMSFPAKYVVNPDFIKEKSIKVTLNPSEMETKGNKMRSIFMPKTLMAELWDFKIFERAKIASECEVLEKACDDVLFLNYRGKQQSPSAFNKVLDRTQVDIGFNVHPHILRHTFATHELHSMRESGNISTALMWVKERMGHSSVKTTEGYLHLLAEIDHHFLSEVRYDLDKLMHEQEAKAGV